MKTIEMLKPMAAHGRALHTGQVVKVTDELAASWVGAGLAKETDAPKRRERERAVREPAERRETTP